MEDSCFGYFVQKAHPHFENTSKAVLDFGMHLLVSVDVSFFYQFGLMKLLEKFTHVEAFLQKPANINMTKQT